MSLPGPSKSQAKILQVSWSSTRVCENPSDWKLPLGQDSADHKPRVFSLRRRKPNEESGNRFVRPAPGRRLVIRTNRRLHQAGRYHFNPAGGQGRRQEERNKTSQKLKTREEKQEEFRWRLRRYHSQITLP